MTTIVKHRTVVTEEMPSGLLTLKLPPGITLDKWVKQETDRIRKRYPTIKVPYVELGPEEEEMLRIARRNRNEWEMRYELIKLRQRELLGYAKQGTSNGIPFIDRRVYHVDEYSTPEFDVDAIFPL